jgi:hypothetical protein
VTIARPLPASFADLCTPEEVGEDLARALASLLCRGLGHAAGSSGSCADCRAAGRILAAHVGRALFACRRRGRSRLRPDDYGAVGRALDLLEQAAGT